MNESYGRTVILDESLLRRLSHAADRCVQEWPANKGDVEDDNPTALLRMVWVAANNTLRELADLRAENERLCALVEKRLAPEDGYTILDFLRVWHDQQKARADKAEARVAELEVALRELRIRYHAAGRRPEECYEMSLIDAALIEKEGE